MPLTTERQEWLASVERRRRLICARQYRALQPDPRLPRILPPELERHIEWCRLEDTRARRRCPLDKFAYVVEQARNLCAIWEINFEQLIATGAGGSLHKSKTVVENRWRLLRALRDMEFSFPEIAGALGMAHGSVISAIKGGRPRRKAVAA